MGWTRFFRSHHSEWLEEQFEKLKADHARQIEDLKSSHASELTRAINETERLRDEVSRLRLYLTPALQNVQLDPDRSPPPMPNADVYAGTPWQRVLARELKLQEQEAATRFTKPADAPVATEGDQHAEIIGRNAFPQSEPGKNA